MCIFTVTERRTNSTDTSNLWPLTPIFAQITLFYNGLSWLPLPPELTALPLQSACSSWKPGTALSIESIPYIFLQVPRSWRSTRLNHPAKAWWCTGLFALEPISHATERNLGISALKDFVTSDFMLWSYLDCIKARNTELNKGSTTVLKKFLQGYREARAKLFSEVHSDRTRGNRCQSRNMGHPDEI